MKKILGLDLGTNSIGWALVEQDFEKKEGKILGMGSRIIPMSQDVLGKFDSGVSISQTAERTEYRGARRLYQRDNLRRDRLHRVLNVLGFLPEHYAECIDFEHKLGQFKPDTEEKINYRRNENGKYEFIFKDSFNEMVQEFKEIQPQLFYTKENGKETKIPYDWTIYYLRKKALSQKLTKEELAWIVLNFNQKRGYYQLRGDEADKQDDTKREEFYALKVTDVEETEDKNAKGVWYNITLENGWIYRRQSKESLNNWIGKIKEFIVTTQLEKDGTEKTDKEGEVKRSFRAVNSEQDWIAIKSKTEQDIDKTGETVGEYIYKTLLNNPNQKIRGKLVKTIERKYYKDEFKQIISKQIEIQPELFTDELYLKCIEELYPRNEAHQQSIKDEDFKYLFTDDIIFYQRPLKSQKSNIAGCQLEFREYKKKNEETGKEEIVKEPVKAISKSHPLFQEFRTWQWLQNLRIYNKHSISNGQLEDVTYSFLKTEDDRVDLFDFLNTKKEVEQKHILEYFVKKKLIEKNDKEKYRWNYVYDEKKDESKKYPVAETHSQFVSRLNKVEGVENVNDFLLGKTLVGNEETGKQISREEQLWHIIYSVSDLNEYKSALTKFATKHNINKDSFADNFIKFPPFDSDYGSYSKKALEKLLPLMRMGKYWDEKAIDETIKDRANAILERVNGMNLNENYSEKELKEALSKVSDDDIPKQLIKSFIPFKDKSPFKGLNTYQATYLAYGRHSESGEIQYWKTPDDINRFLKNFKQHSLRNPIVEQVVTETLRVVRDIWNYYGNGENNFFNEIHLELGREMKNPKEKREKISKKNIENENTNQRIREILKELMNDTSIEGDVRDYSPSQQEILRIYEDDVLSYNELPEDVEKIKKKFNESDIKKKPTSSEIKKYRLWLEQKYLSPYTGKPILLSKLFTHAYQIEHIIPQSRYFDNSMTNKVICESEVNEDKGNMTAYEYLNKKGGELIHGHKLLLLNEYENHVKKYFKSNRQKLKNLLSEDIPEGFINRQLNDSRYISKLVKGLLSNIVREESEQEATSKNLIPVNGAVTSQLKNDWGLNYKWNELILPRFERLNELTQSNQFTVTNTEGKTIPTVPNNLMKGFNKKRIDHRHHALDALVVACTTRNHTHYLSALNAEKENLSLRDKLLVKNKNNHYTKTFQMPWQGFPTEAKNNLEKAVVSFKQNTRVINKTNNKFWSYKDENGNLNIGKDGKPKKKLRKQTKGDNWAIRQKLHEETNSAKVYLPWVETKDNEITTATRKSLDKSFTLKKIEKITDKGIQKILKNYLKQEKFKEIDGKGNIIYNSEMAFSQEGIEDLNKNIKLFNEGKNHQPIYKVRIYEKGTGRFQLLKDNQNNQKFVQGSPNLFFTIYKSENEKFYKTIPLDEVIAHQKYVAHLPKEERTLIPIYTTIKKSKGEEFEVDFVLSLSPLDLVYIPTNSESENAHLIDFNNLSEEQMKRLYNVNDFSGGTCYFSPNSLAKAICPKEVDMSYDIKKQKITGSFDTKTASLAGNSIKERCWKLKVNRLGNITKVIR